jgi:hypothetical protein
MTWCLSWDFNWPMMQIAKKNMRWLYNTWLLLFFFMDVIQLVRHVRSLATVGLTLLTEVNGCA